MLNKFRKNLDVVIWHHSDQLKGYEKFSSFRPFFVIRPLIAQNLG